MHFSAKNIQRSLFFTNLGIHSNFCGNLTKGCNKYLSLFLIIFNIINSKRADNKYPICIADLCSIKKNTTNFQSLKPFIQHTNILLRSNHDITNSAPTSTNIHHISTTDKSRQIANHTLNESINSEHAKIQQKRPPVNPMGSERGTRP